MHLIQTDFKSYLKHGTNLGFQKNNMRKRACRNIKFSLSALSSPGYLPYLFPGFILKISISLPWAGFWYSLWGWLISWSIFETRNRNKFNQVQRGWLRVEVNNRSFCLSQSARRSQSIFDLNSWEGNSDQFAIPLARELNNHLTVHLDLS